MAEAKPKPTAKPAAKAAANPQQMTREECLRRGLSPSVYGLGDDVKSAK